MRTVLLGVCILFQFVAGAQRACGWSEYRESVPAPLSGLSLDLPLTASGGAATEGIIRIPVVFHVVYGSPSQNISEAQIRSQIDALNADFRRRRFDTSSTPEAFKAVAADAGIEFVLATADPQGKPTSGITRHATRVADWGLDDRIKMPAQGGAAPWDSRAYLNIWVGNLRNLLGYASAPGGPAERDGIVLHYGAVGTINTAPPFHLGRTAVHEAGHWLGLRHIWGDSFCGDDGVEDTPKQGNFTSGCPSGVRSTCANTGAGDMYMNFMDFTNDACINLFTLGQRQRMRAQFSPGGARHSLLTSRGGGAPWAQAPPAEPQATVQEKAVLFPNPATDVAVLDLRTSSGKEAWLLVDAGGRTLRQWMLQPGQHRLQLAGLRRGMYYLVSGKKTLPLQVL